METKPIAPRLTYIRWLGGYGKMLLMATKYTGKLGPFIKALREEANLTAEELATQVGCSRGAITSIEIGKTRLPSPDLVEALSRVLGVSQARIMYQAGYLTEHEAAMLSRPENVDRAIATAEDLRRTLAELKRSLGEVG